MHEASLAVYGNPLLRPFLRLVFLASLGVSAIPAAKAGPGHVTTEPRLFILAVGVGKYNALPRLGGPAGDAADFSSALSRISGKMQSAEVVVLKDAEATRSRLTDAVYKIARVARPWDMFVFYFSGHAVPPQQDFNAPRILLYDADDPVDGDLSKYLPNAVANDSLSSHDLMSLLSEIPAQRQVLFLDACYSGAFVATLTARATNESLADKAQNFDHRDLCVFCSSAATSTSWEVLTPSGRVRGLFTLSVLNAIQRVVRGSAAITLHSLEAALYAEGLKAEEEKDAVPSWPCTYYTSDFDFLFRGPGQPSSSASEQSVTANPPSIKGLVNPPATRSVNLTESEKTLVKVRVSGPVSACTINGQEARADDDCFEAVLDLPLGQTQVKVVLIPPQGVTVEQTFAITRVKSEAPIPIVQGKNYALLIALDSYDDPAWPKLDNPINDAGSVKSELENDYGFQTELLQNPTKAQVRAALKKYRDLTYGPNDQFLFYWAGHGLYDLHDPSGYLVVKDSASPESDPDRDRFIDDSWLRDQLSTMACNHVLLLLDSCFSGTFGNIKPGTENPAVGAELLASLEPAVAQVDPRMRAEAINLAYSAKCREYIASGMYEVNDKGQQADHSPFASDLISVLQSGMADGFLRYDELKSRLQHLAKSSLPIPGTFGDDNGIGEFVLIPKG